MGLDDRAGDREAEAGAVGVPGGIRAAAEEGVEDALALLGRDAVAAPARNANAISATTGATLPGGDYESLTV